MGLFKVELVGTRLGDYGYVMASGRFEARKIVKKDLLKLNGGDKSLVPEIDVEEVTSTEALKDIWNPNDLHKAQDTVEKLLQGNPVYDFKDFG